jgi:ribosomal protein L37AE/L43A
MSRTPRRNHNAYWALHEQGTVALPDAIPLDKMNPAAVKLYLCLLRQQKMARANPFTAHSGDLVLDANISPNALTAARNQLSTLGLIVTTDKPGEKGQWLYELRHPVTSAALPAHEQVRFADLSDWAIGQFYARLRPGTRDPYDCPACGREGIKIDMRPGDTRGRWSCKGCGKYGGFANAYKHAYKIDYPTATLMTRSLLLEILDAEKQPARPAHAVYLPVDAEEMVAP